MIDEIEAATKKRLAAEKEKGIADAIALQKENLAKEAEQRAE